MRGATARPVVAASLQHVSIHAPHAGRDSMQYTTLSNTMCFNPRAPCGARHAGVGATTHGASFQSTRPMRGATVILPIFRDNLQVSIHAPHAGRDQQISADNKTERGFNPRAPCGARLPCKGFCVFHPCFNPRAPCGARRRACVLVKSGKVFQSTRPMRGATMATSGSGSPLWSFNPRAPCGARQGAFRICEQCYVSIHAPHAGRDQHSPLTHVASSVSIHAPHAGRDLHFPLFPSLQDAFQSTRPMRGATYHICYY